MVKSLRRRGREGQTPSAFVPLKFEQGEAFQFDWSEENLVIGGLYRKLQVSHVKLCASRAFWLVAYPSQGHEMLFDAHTRSFAALGGIPRRGIYDNMKTAVDKVKKGSGAPSMIWLDAQNRKFGSFAELNVWLGERCRSLWNELRHPEHQEFCIADMLEQERAEMMPMPTPFDGYVEKSARVSSTCLVSVSRNCSNFCACTAWSAPGRIWWRRNRHPRKPHNG
jgi:hypothetical protein